MRGRKPKPTVLKDLHGSTETRNLDEPVPTTQIDAVAPPDHFDDEMRQVWTDALESAPIGMLKAIDASVMEAWVVARVLHRRAVRAQGRNTLLMRTAGAYPAQSAYLGIINRQALIMMRAAAELGFSPTSRPRVGGAGGGADLGGGARDASEESLDRYLEASPAPPALH